jgi:ABC-type multidrug transport system ATPase subunit
MNKVASLIKALLNEGQFLFLEEPENHLEQETLKLFSDALKAQLEEKEVNIFIYSKNSDFWKPHAHKSVSRNKDFSFKIEEINKHSQWEKERQHFYSKSSENQTNTLVFHNLKKVPAPSKKDAA